eukprot:Rmarinus@m.20171
MKPGFKKRFASDFHIRSTLSKSFNLRRGRSMSTTDTTRHRKRSIRDSLLHLFGTQNEEVELQPVDPTKRTGKQLWKLARAAYFSRMAWTSSAIHDSRLVLGELIDDDDERVDASHETHHGLIILPDSKPLRFWNCLQVFLLLYISLVVPLRFGFVDEPEPDSVPFVIDVFVDLFFVIDIIIRFRTAYVENFRVVTDPQKIARAYTRSLWFYFDLISCFPINYVVLLWGGIGSNTARVNRLFRFTRLARILRVVRINRLLRHYEDDLWEVLWLIRLARLSFCIIFVAHFMCCIWYYVGLENEVSGDGRTVLGWVAQQEWADEEALYTRYITSFYWAITSMTTVGYGDIIASTTNEKLYAVGAMILGGYLFGLVIGNISNVISDEHSSSHMYNLKMKSLKEFLYYRQVPSELQTRIRRFYEVLFVNKTVFDEKDIVTSLPHSLKTNLVRHLYRDLVSKVPLFNNLDEEVVTKVCLMMQPYRGVPGDIITKEGEVGRELYVICSGSVLLTYKDLTKRILHKNSFFGELALLGLGGGLDGSRHLQTATALSYCELAFISREDLKAVSADYPSLCEEISVFAAKRRRVLQHLDPELPHPTAYQLAHNMKNILLDRMSTKKDLDQMAHMLLHKLRKGFENDPIIARPTESPTVEVDELIRKIVRRTTMFQAKALHDDGSEGKEAPEFDDDDDDVYGTDESESAGSKCSREEASGLLRPTPDADGEDSGGSDGVPQDIFPHSPLLKQVVRQERATTGRLKRKRGVGLLKGGNGSQLTHASVHEIVREQSNHVLRELQRQQHALTERVAAMEGSLAKILHLLQSQNAHHSTHDSMGETADSTATPDSRQIGFLSPKPGLITSDSVTVAIDEGSMSNDTIDHNDVTVTAV